MALADVSELSREIDILCLYSSSSTLYVCNADYPAAGALDAYSCSHMFLGRDIMRSDFNDLRTDLLHLVAEPDRRVRAVIDGARFDDLPLELARAGLEARPLYRGPDRDFMAAGPFLIDPYRRHARNSRPADLSEIDPSDEEAAASGAVSGTLETEAESPFALAIAREQTEALLDLIGPTHAAVFWIGPSGMTDDVLFRQLRTLNKVLVPSGWASPPTMTS